jgi:dihydroxy-acid dehydratase
LPGGTQLNAPDYVTSDKMWEMGAEAERGELPRQDLETAQRNACPTCGACQFMGSASTGQVLAEALGLALPGSALTPAPLTKLLRYARAAGKQLVTLIEENLTPRRIRTRAQQGQPVPAESQNRCLHTFRGTAVNRRGHHRGTGYL